MQRSSVWRLCGTDGTTQVGKLTTQHGSRREWYNLLSPIKLTDFHNFLNQSNCNICEMMFCKQRNPKLKHQVPAVHRSWLSTERHPHYSIHHTANTRKFPYGDVASWAVQRWSAMLRFRWINKKMLSQLDSKCNWLKSEKTPDHNENWNHIAMWWHTKCGKRTDFNNVLVSR